MPLHDFECDSCSTVTEQSVAHGVAWIVCPTCCSPAQKVFLRAPRGYVQPDICYDSPVDGRPITNKHARAEDLRRNNCIEYDPEMRKDVERRRIDEEKRFDASLDQTIDATIAAMPARKREQLETEARGAEVQLNRV